MESDSGLLARTRPGEPQMSPRRLCGASFGVSGPDRAQRTPDESQEVLWCQLMVPGTGRVDSITMITNYGSGLHHHHHHRHHHRCHLKIWGFVCVGDYDYDYDMYDNSNSISHVIIIVIIIVIVLVTLIVIVRLLIHVILVLLFDYYMFRASWLGPGLEGPR